MKEFRTQTEEIEGAYETQLKVPMGIWWQIWNIILTTTGPLWDPQGMLQEMNLYNTFTVWSLKNGNTFYSNSNYVALRNYYAVSSTSAACNTANSLIIAFRGTETRDIVLLTWYSGVKAPGCTASIYYWTKRDGAVLNGLAQSQKNVLMTGWL